MSLTSPDFESGAYTNFATPAVREDNKASSLYGATAFASFARQRTRPAQNNFLFLKPCLTLISWRDHVPRLVASVLSRLILYNDGLMEATISSVATSTPVSRIKWDGTLAVR
jgi:hypothetical protein